MPNHVQANPSLELTIKTDKQKYYNKELVTIYGNLTQDGTPTTNALVGIQIQTQSDQLVVIRTVPASSPPQETPYVFLEYVVPCDENGNPKFSFKRKSLSYFKISVANLDIEPREALLTINTFYGDGVPFGHASIQAILYPQSYPIFVISVPIPDDAPLGTAWVYANAYTNWPKLGGTPYGVERNATFEITDSTLAGAYQTTLGTPITTMQTNETGNYNLTFRLARTTPAGNYMVYATSRYMGEIASNTTTFTVTLLGDLGGGTPPQFFLFDGKIDGKDLSLFLQCFKGLAPPEAMYLADLGGGTPPQFFLFDDKVDGKDLSLFLQCFKGLGP